MDGLVDFSGPVIHLENLTPEDLFILLTKIRGVFAKNDPEQYLLQDEDIQNFMAHCSQTIGEAYFRTPRNTITAFINLLAVLEQNPEAQLDQLIRSQSIEVEVEAATPSKVKTTRPRPTASVVEEDDLAAFEL